MYDFHMHSGFSSDCDAPMASMIESAIEAGLKEITFTDHIDYEYNSTEIEFEFDTDAYVKEIDRLREVYAGKIVIHVGIEMGIQPHILNRCTALVKKVKPDFVIASQHNVGKMDLYLGDYYKNKTPEEALSYAMNELKEMVEQYDAFCVVGHLDILKRYDEAVRNLPKELYLTYAEPVLKTIIAKGKGIEVNTSGLRQGLNETLPSYELLTLYHKLGGKILTIGADAHKPEDVGHSFLEVLKELNRIGFEYLYTFEKMMPIAHHLEDVIETFETKI